ncbi:MAG: pyridoxamine 5'-phosphate oxidase family protein [Chloroflexi bacterium]|nr:pyridoxamine 5'-phosphate oxidase family protein [Chloroflexota bacterium]
MTIAIDVTPTARRVPESFLDLAECPRAAVLTTLTKDGYPQTSVVWCDLERASDDADDLLRINTMAGFAKTRNMARDPRVTVLAFDPREPLRCLEIRGWVIDMTLDGAGAHLDAIASKYMGRPVRYFGECIPARFAESELPVLCRIRPDRIVANDWRTPAGRGSSGGAAVPTSVPAPGVPAPDGQPFDRAADVAMPPSHLDLLTGQACGVLTTIFPSGQPHSTIVWVDLERTAAGEAVATIDGRPACALVNTTLERWVGRNLASSSNASLLVVDPENTARYVQIRGDVELVRDGAVEQLDAVTRRYTRHPCFYGHVYPIEQLARDTRVIARLHARRITVDAIHA